jgi:7-cyano-7-deazaguanine reductase
MKSTSMRLDSLGHLGKNSVYPESYDPNLLYAVSRADKREALGINPTRLPFHGIDTWNHYEISWLNARGKPQVALMELVYDCQSPFLIESKSLKLYFNSLNEKRFQDQFAFLDTVKADLESCIKSPVTLTLYPVDAWETLFAAKPPQAICLDQLDIDLELNSNVNPELNPGLNTGSLISELLYSHLLKSNCLITGQPDWATIFIDYTGQPINHASLLQYLISYRQHQEFHEQCVERIFMDILQQAKPTHLSVYARYTRRGGLDINPFRSTHAKTPALGNLRLLRQ